MINVAVIMGRLTTDPELRTTNSGTSVTNFSVAVDRNYQRNGEHQADFINVTAWQGTAEFITRYFHKGSMIAVQGPIQSEPYTDRNGNRRISFSIIANQVSFAGGRSENQANGSTKVENKAPAANEPVEAVPEEEQEEPVFDGNDDLPF